MKQFAFFIALVAVAASITEASCPNACSGHGSCGARDACTCQLKRDGTPAYAGPDCSQKICPSGVAWFDTPSAYNVAHDVAPCSNRGNCDMKTGTCVCNEGFTGNACDKFNCPNNCNNRGVCYSESNLASMYAHNGAGYTYSLAWDSAKIYGCVCDPGFRGPDCSLAECPSGVDVLGGDGGKQGRECSGRGTCDWTTGVCTCFDGYTGLACGSQSL